MDSQLFPYLKHNRLSVAHKPGTKHQSHALGNDVLQCELANIPLPTLPPECFEGTCGELCGEFCEEGQVCDYEGSGHCVAGVCSCV